MSCRLEKLENSRAGKFHFRNGKRILGFLFLIAVLADFSCFPSYAVETDASDEAMGNSGLPLPRFASVRSSEANLRTGPGTRYPIDWVFTAKGMPLEITAEYDVWRRVRDFEGAEGWVHKSNLTGVRGAIVTGAARDLRKDEKGQSPVVAHLEPGVIGQILSCSTEWCRLKFENTKGYLRKTDFWGAYAEETFN